MLIPCSHFGLRSTPKIFTAVADGLIWIMGNNCMKKALHYLDDYLFFGMPHSSECADALGCAPSLCEKLGVPTSKEKIEGPSTALSFLGILLDPEAGQIRLPEEKLQRLKAVIRGCRENIAADALSHDNFPLFLQQVQHAAQQPTLIPEELIQALVTHRPDWTSQNWRTWFTTILERISRLYSTHLQKYPGALFEILSGGRFTPLPVSQSLLCKYVSHLANENLKHGTIKVYLSAVRHLQIKYGMNDPFAHAAWPQLDLMMRRIIKVEAEKGGGKRERLYLTMPPAETERCMVPAK